MWPKTNPEITDDLDYAKDVVQEYDSNNKGAMDFIEFCRFMEDLWKSSDKMKEQNCNVGFEKSTKIFTKLFEWLDRDSDGSITPDDIMHGVSRIMIRDVDWPEVQNVFATHDPKKTGKISLEPFLLAIANGQLDNTFKDEKFTNTFIK